MEDSFFIAVDKLFLSMHNVGQTGVVKTLDYTAIEKLEL